MADTSTRITGPVEIKQNSAASVAYDLMKLISGYEDGKNEKKDRKYWLTLYHQCQKATHGHSLDVILKNE